MCLQLWHFEKLHVLWVGSGISSAKAPASIIQFVVQLWMASVGAILVVSSALIMMVSVCMVDTYSWLVT